MPACDRSIKLARDSQTSFACDAKKSESDFMSDFYCKLNFELRENATAETAVNWMNVNHD